MAGTANRENFYTRVNATKNALINEWKKEGCFKDKNNFLKSGLIPEGVGLTSVLLMLVAFGEDDIVFSTEEKEDVVGMAEFSEVINSSFKKIFAWTENGFGAAPLLNKKNSVLFDEGRGYTETVTWCLSSAILALYAEKNFGLVLEEEVHQGALTLLGKSFKALLSAQREDGAWGFTTDGRGCRSLYFTYVASASLADFFDYVLDEISIVENADGEKTESCPMENVISFLNEYLNCDSVALANETRGKLDKFLIEKCLPILPKLACCDEMSEEELDEIGAWRTAAYPNEKAADKKYYNNLYYTYYILDMLITASADTYFDTLATDSSKRAELLEMYRMHMKQYEIEYYSCEERFAELFSNIYEQALHSSRMNYLNAARTGDTFWDKTASELPIYWEHEDVEIQKMAETALDQSQATLTDPTILPMALRANTVYSYYVTEKPEITIERLFDDVCANVYTGEIDEDDDEHVVDLWDTVYYNLMITERSIESVVDFYDYLNKFECQETPTVNKVAKASAQQTVSHVAIPSAIDAAVEQKIAEYLQSEEGNRIVENIISSKLTSSQLTSNTPSVAVSVQTIPDDREITKWMENVEKILSQRPELQGERAELLEQMIDLFEKLRIWSFRKIFDEGEWSSNDIANVSKDYEERRMALLRAIGTDIKVGGSDHLYDLEELYKEVKKLRN